MTDEREDVRVDEALRDLRAALAVEPSPEFAVRVRAQVERERARGWPRHWRTWMIALVPATAALVFVLLAPFNQTTPAPTRPVASIAPRAEITRTAGTPAPAVATSAVAGDVPAVQPNRSRARAVITAAVDPPRRELEVLVPDDQRVALMRLLAALREGRAAVPPGAPIIDEITGELLRPTPLEMPPITVEPLPGTPDNAGGGKGDR